MAKDKKAKKGRAGEIGQEEASSEAVQDSPAVDQSISSRSVKKGKKGRKDDWGDSVADEISHLSLENETPATTTTKKSKKDQRKVEVENGFSDDEDKTKPNADLDGDSKSLKKKGKAPNNMEEPTTAKQKKGKKGKQSVDSDDGLSDIVGKLNDTTLNEEEAEPKKKSKKSKAKPSGFQLLDVEGDDMLDKDDDDRDVPSPEPKPVAADKDEKSESKAGKKSKKKERRKKDEDDEDIDKVLEQLAMEMSGQMPVEVPKATEQFTKAPEPLAATDSDSKQAKKKNKAEVVSTDVAEETQSKDSVEQLDDEHTVKTAAQKKKEKKDKEKQKKLAQYEQQKRSVKKTEETVTEEKTKTVEIPQANKEEKAIAEEKDDKEQEMDEDEADDKKKKKKKKKDDEDKKGEKKRPGKKQIAAMQEALKKVKEEEERLRLEEEAKIKAEEEAEQIRQEKLRIEQEKKEMRKKREKEKRERLKAEGKLLSKSQKQSKARMEATLAVLRQQGVDVPQVGGCLPNSAPRLRDRRQKKKNQESQDKVHENVIMEIKDSVAPEPMVVEENKDDSVAKAVEEQKQEEEDNIKDAWDESTDEESEMSSKADVRVSSVGKDSANTDESEEDDSDSDDSETSDSESESDSDSDDGKTNEERMRERAVERIKKRREDAENNRTLDKLRSPVVCVLGHVDTGKTKILDRIRRTHVQDCEAGGITQQIGATMVPDEALKEQCKMVKSFTDSELKVPGLLIIDTPGHESFSNLRSRGSSLCDIAILVVDIMHGLEPQTIESIDMLKQKKTPFIVALNKIDRLYEWKSLRNRDIQDVIKSQARNTKMEFEDRAKEVILQFAEQGLNAVLFYDNKDARSYISMVPTSALTGDGMGNLMSIVVNLTQSMMAKRLAFSEELQATVLEVKAIPGLGTTIDAILVNGRLREGDTMIVAGYEGPVVTQIRSILMPQPLKELRVKNFYEEFKEVQGAQGVKLTGKDLDKAIAGLQLLVAQHPDEVQILKDEVASTFREAMSCIKLAERGVYVQASTLGSLEALLDFLKTSKIPYSGIRIGPVVKKDVMKASIMLEHDSQYAVILAFDVKIEKDAQELADSLGVKIFQADIIYHLFDKFTAYREELKNKKRDEFKSQAVFPCKLRILPQYIFNSRDPIVMGVIVEAGIIREGTPLCVPTKEFLEIGIVTTIEVNHKTIESARKGQEVCIKIEPSGGEAPKMYGRHFEHTDMLVSKITRQSIDVCKEYFRDDLLKTDWQLMVELKKTFQIL